MKRVEKKKRKNLPRVELERKSAWGYCILTVVYIIPGKYVANYMYTPVYNITGLSGLLAEAEQTHPLTPQPYYKYYKLTNTNTKTITAPSKKNWNLVTKTTRYPFDPYIIDANVIPH